MVILEKVDHRTRDIINDKEGNFIKIKESIYQENITPTVYWSKNRASKYMKPNFIRRVLVKSINITGDLNTSFSIIVTQVDRKLEKI